MHLNNFRRIENFNGKIVLLASVLFMLLFMSLSLQLSAQSIKNLESKKKKLYKDIKLSGELLSETRSEQKSSVSELKFLQKQLKTREDLLEAYSAEIDEISKNIADLESGIALKEKELELQKLEYAKMIRYAYENRTNQSFLLFLLSADSFNDAYRRVQYIRQYNQVRTKQVEIIKNQQDEIAVKIEALRSKKQSQADIIEDAKTERNKLIAETKQKNALLKELKQKEEELNDEIERKKVAVESLEQEIKSIIQKNIEKRAEEKRKKEEAAQIAKEIREAEAKANSKGETPSKTIEKDLPKTPEVVMLGSNFVSNKGRLHWPVGEGIITGRFGKHRHSEASAVQVENSGIDISTKKGANVSVVYDGVVTNIIYSPIFQSAVIVQHGDYFSVYSNLEQVTASKGQEVKAKESIGRVGTNENGKTEINFQVWNGTKKLNPISWLKKR